MVGTTVIMTVIIMKFSRELGLILSTWNVLNSLILKVTPQGRFSSCISFWVCSLRMVPPLLWCPWSIEGQSWWSRPAMWLHNHTHVLCTACFRGCHALLWHSRSLPPAAYVVLGRRPALLCALEIPCTEIPWRWIPELSSLSLEFRYLHKPLLFIVPVEVILLNWFKSQ